MDRLAAALLVLSLSLSSLSAQSKENASRSDGRTAFDRLLAAHDADLVDVVKNNRLVCFADENVDWLQRDRFLVVVTSEPKEFGWTNTEGNDPGKTIYGSESALGQQYGHEEVFVWENEDSLLWVSSGLTGLWRAVGHYAFQGGRRRWVGGDIGPVFRYSMDNDKANLIESIIQDSTTFAATKKYQNKANGTTDWNLSVRLSTGRYRETWETTGDTRHGESESLGRCYRAKTLVKTTATTGGKK